MTERDDVVVIGVRCAVATLVYHLAQDGMNYRIDDLAGIDLHGTRPGGAETALCAEAAPQALQVLPKQFDGTAGEAKS